MNTHVIIIAAFVFFANRKLINMIGLFLLAFIRRAVLIGRVTLYSIVGHINNI